MTGVKVTRAVALELAKERLRAGEELTPALARIVLEELARGAEAQVFMEYSPARLRGSPW